MFSQARYRTEQFFAALRPVVSADDLRLASRVLGDSSPAMALFLQMSRTDQQHALAVLRTLLGWGVDDPALQQAALLHDVGKSLGQPLPHRVIIVLLGKFLPGALNRLANAPLTCPTWRRPFVVHARHPQIGAELAAAAGCNPSVVTLIRTHQQPPATAPSTSLETLHRYLYQADTMH